MVWCTSGLTYLNKAIFLDRDGTINREKNYLYKAEDFEFLPGVIEALKLLQDAGFLLILITNQSGIARGYYEEADFLSLNGWMLEELEKQGVIIQKVYYCPHLPNAKIEKYRKVCTCRKPQLGLYQQAVQEFEIDLSKSYAIGDKVRDCSICEKTLCRGFLISENEKEEIIFQVKKGRRRNIRYAASLADAVKTILEERL